MFSKEKGVSERIRTCEKGKRVLRLPTRLIPTTLEGKPTDYVHNLDKLLPIHIWRELQSNRQRLILLVFISQDMKERGEGRE